VKRRRKKKLSSGDRKGLAIFAVVGVLVLALASARLIIGSGDKYDPNTLCPLNAPYPRTVVIIDVTDPLSESQRLSVRNKLDSLRDDLEKFEKLVIYALDETNFASPEPIFSLCRPGTGQDANELYQNPKKIRARYDKQFGDPLDQLLLEVSNKKGAKVSPIMEMIRNVAYTKDLAANDVRKRLIIVSDLLQHTKDYSHYRTKADYTKFSTSHFSSQVQAPLLDVDVYIHYLLRPKNKQLQSAGHVLFWEQYIAHAGANISGFQIGP
jgi:hypothetical protein